MLRIKGTDSGNGRYRRVQLNELSILTPSSRRPAMLFHNLLWHGRVEDLIARLPCEPMFDLVVTSPPYNIGKAYERKQTLEQYAEWQAGIIDSIVPRVNIGGSICWQVGNFVENGHIVPLDIALDPLFRKHGLRLRNRIIWQFGHGLHTKRRFSGRYEVVMWYTRSDEYVFNLDSVRVPAKYPGKRHFKGPKTGQFSGNPLGKNPEDVWDIPNVKNNHIEKTDHPCQFPVGLIERLVLALTNENGLVFDPFSGVGSAGVAAILHRRRFWEAEIDEAYVRIAKVRIEMVQRRRTTRSFGSWYRQSVPSTRAA